MTDIDLQNEKDLMKCWRKKTVSVSAKVILALAYIIDGIAVMWISIYESAVIWGVIKSPTVVAATFVGEFVGYAIEILLGIPWYIYAGVVGIAAIPIYSWAWCIAREFTEDDWDLNGNLYAATWYESVLLPILVIPALIEGCINKDGKAYHINKILSFTGAYLRYRKRTRSNK